jgi:hypothetical protein
VCRLLVQTVRAVLRWLAVGARQTFHLISPSSNGCDLGYPFRLCSPCLGSGVLLSDGEVYLNRTDSYSANAEDLCSRGTCLIFSRGSS